MNFKINLFLITLISSFNASALLINSGGGVLYGCAEAIPMGGTRSDLATKVAACAITSTTTSLPTVIIDDTEFSIDSIESLAKAVEESAVNHEEQDIPATQTLAEYFGVSAEEIQKIVNRLYQTGADVSIETIEQELLKQ